LDTVFASYYLNFEQIRKQVIAKATLSANSNINQESLKTIKIEIPPLPLQQKIAKILTTCDEVIEKTEAAIAKYKAIKQGMMQDLFTRGIDVSTGKLRPSYQEAPELYKESELGVIPKEWEVKRLEEIGDIVTGNTPPTSNKDYYDGNIMFISPFDISDSKFITKSEKKITDLGLSVSRQIPINTICVVCIGSTIGKMGMSIELSTTNQQINSIIVFSKNLSEFFYYSCKINLPKQLLVEAGLQAVPIVNKSTFEKLLISLPQLQAESIKISSILNSYDEKLQAEESSLSKYKKLKEGLMQDLLTGKVEVSE
ncbi:MAG: restriction endonuclease subunit S, partial [Flectobacillus sp.]|nr:restriction endonuclease subunit S [Flectobacillus sp.]